MYGGSELRGYDGESGGGGERAHDGLGLGHGIDLRAEQFVFSLYHGWIILFVFMKNLGTFREKYNRVGRT